MMLAKIATHVTLNNSNTSESIGLYFKTHTIHWKLNSLQEKAMTFIITL